MIAIVDYGVGNLFSLQSSFAAIGEKAIVTGQPEMLRQADRIVLPGVGAFEDAANKLKKLDLDTVIKDEAARGKPLLGICLGMQLLLERSYEYGIHEGLGLIPGEVKPIETVIPNDLKIPHIGWNRLIYANGRNSLFRNVDEGSSVYFVHSYYAASPEEYIIAKTEYGSLLTAAVCKENVFGCQFHPEKSGRVGLNILEAFCREV